jgi:hypothetical protein
MAGRTIISLNEMEVEPTLTLRLLTREDWRVASRFVYLERGALSHLANAFLDILK